ncbi:DUF4058 family protein [Frigoriglobus tundricola]|uniref:DUF4058 family protein n=1 Tax=Frigoriglobus tundricola TaxID=2774151 RepID=A0A6M5YTT7_9BACT|nr:DUF4058 family protein [Frigoriglobus tundricola]QJW97448.1 hypothetical protein FTUN_5022 [Frigoriglobus tundricola]
MPSPFPGMNPYLEQSSVWRDFHASFLVTLRSVLVPRVRPKYHVELEESLFIDPTGDGPRLFAVADSAVADPAPEERGPGGTVTVTVVAAPLTVTVPGVTKKKMRRLVVRDSKSQDEVTAIELLSPSNKAAGADRDKYLERRVEVLTSAANFVELDFLRGGQRMPIRPRPECEYYALVSRAWQRPEIGLGPLKLRDPLPAIPVPLRPGEPEPLIELKAVLDRTDDEAGYEDRTYRTPPDPPLTAADTSWARAFVPAPVAP